MVKPNICVEWNKVIGLVKTKDSISLCNECNNKYISDSNPYYKNNKPIWRDFTDWIYVINAYFVINGS